MSNGSGPGAVHERPPRERVEHPAMLARRRSVARELGRRRRDRALLAAGCAVAVVAGWWLATGPLLSPSGLAVAGYDRPDEPALREALAAAAAEGSAITPDPRSIGRAAIAFPWVEQIRVERDLPRSLVVSVTQARPAGYLQGDDGNRVLVSSNGRVLEAAAQPAAHGTMRIAGPTPAPGAVVTDEQLQLLGFLGALSPEVAPHLSDLILADGTVTAQLAWGTEVRLGRPERLPAKATALSLMLSALSEEERQAATYVDLTVPEHPAVGPAADYVPGQDPSLDVQTGGADEAGSEPGGDDDPAAGAEPDADDAAPVATPGGEAGEMAAP